MTIAEKLREQGREIGRLKAKQEIALRMLREGIETAFIANMFRCAGAGIL